MENKLEQLKASGANVLENEPLSKHVNFRIGGPTKYYAEVKSIDETKSLIQAAKDEGIDYIVLGGGANVLVSDDGFDGLVIKLGLRGTKVEGDKLIAEAGAMNAAAARTAAEAGLTGLEWAVTIPGTVGGMVYGNAGCYGSETKDVVESVEVLKDGKIVTLKNKNLDFGYRHSILKDDKSVIALEVTFKLKSGDKAEIDERMKYLIEQRKEAQPFANSSAGCVFKNFEFKDDSDVEKLKRIERVPEEFIQNKVIPAGWLIQKLGLKEKSIGGAEISDIHGNFIVNNGDATASDVIQLISLAKMRARDEYGIQLQEEVQYVGF